MRSGTLLGLGLLHVLFVRRLLHKLTTVFQKFGRVCFAKQRNECNSIENRIKTTTK